jgi:ribosomal protein S14
MAVWSAIATAVSDTPARSLPSTNAVGRVKSTSCTHMSQQLCIVLQFGICRQAVRVQLWRMAYVASTAMRIWSTCNLAAPACSSTRGMSHVLDFTWCCGLSTGLQTRSLSPASSSSSPVCPLRRLPARHATQCSPPPQQPTRSHASAAATPPD